MACDGSSPSPHTGTGERGGAGGLTRLHRAFFRCETLSCRQISPLKATLQAGFPPGVTPPRHETNLHQHARLEFAAGGGATTCVPLSLRRASLQFPACVAPPPFCAPLRGAPSRADWLALLASVTRSAVAALWSACSSWPPAVGVGAGGVLLSSSHIAHKLSSLPSAHFPLPRPPRPPELEDQ